MATATDNGVSIAGLIQNIEHSGFKTLDRPSELFDNSIDAEAKEIWLTFATAAETLFVADDGKGMNAEKLRDSKILHNRSEATDSRNGRFGVGGKYAEAICSKVSKPTRTYTKEAGGDLVQVTLNWPEYVAKNKMIIAPHEATKSGEAAWEAHSVNKEHGTVLEIPCDTQRFHDLLELVYASDERVNLIKHFGRMYYVYLNEGGKIVITVNEEVFEVLPIDALEWSTVPDGWKREMEYNVYKGLLGELYVRFLNGKGKEVHYNFATTAKQPKQNEELPEGVTWLGSFVVQSAYKEEWSEGDAGALGGIYLQRKKKVLEHVPAEAEMSGDHKQRKVIMHSRHRYIFGTSLDQESGVLLNKSHVNPKEINSAIWRTVTYQTRDWSMKLYTKYMKPVKEETEDSDDSSVRSYMMIGKGTTPETKEVKKEEVKKVEKKIEKTAEKKDTNGSQTVLNQLCGGQKRSASPPPEPIVDGYRFDITTQDIVVLRVTDATEVFRMNAQGKGSHWREVLMESLRRAKKKEAFESCLAALKAGMDLLS